MAIHRDTDSLILHTDFSFAITYYTYTTTSILRESSDNYALLHQYYPTISLIGVLLSVLYKIMFTNQISVKKVVKFQLPTSFPINLYETSFTYFSF